MSPQHLPGHLEAEHVGDVTVVHFTRGKLLDEHVIQVVGGQLKRLAEQVGRGQLLLNLGNVQAMASMALSQIIALKKKLDAQGGRLVLCNVQPAVHELFELTRLYDFFNLATEPSAPPRAGCVPASVPEGISWKDTLRRVPTALCDPRPAAGGLLRALGRHLNVLHFTDPGDLARYCQKHTPAATALPLFWAGPGGRTDDQPVLRFLHDHARRLAVVVYADTAQVPIGVYSRALVAGAKRVLNDRAAGFADDLRHTLSTLLLQQQISQQEQQHLGERFAAHGLIGQSAALQDVFRRAVKASQFNDLPVLILGETGTGKQRLAEAIHRLDPQRGRNSFLTVNCSAISKSLAESELFGHARGAFSGAGHDRLGLFRAANGGTLMLDEIGELDPDLQPKLLRVLQERRLLPVGDDYEHAIDVRIIAATNRPLKQMVDEGKFRADLYQRLNVFQIRIPPLRERPEDIEVQARHFLQTSQAGRETRVSDFEPRVLEVLRTLPWEGNTRQLQNVIWEVLADKESGAVVQMEDLPHWVLETLADLPARAAATGPGDLLEGGYPDGRSLDEVMGEYERKVLQAALEKNRGNRVRTAAELGLTPRSVFNKIKKYGLG
jgi:anti-anti-sigma factor